MSQAPLPDYRTKARLVSYFAMTAAMLGCILVWKALRRNFGNSVIIKEDNE